MTRFIITRHGVTEWNEKGKIQGHSDIPLSQTGIQQAQNLSQRLKEEKIDLAYTSLLQRAIVTAETALKHHPNVSLTKTKTLNEMHWGDWEGKTQADLEKESPELLDQRDNDKFGFAPPKGESPKMLQERLIPFIEELIEKHPDQTVLITAHNGINRVIIGTLLGWDGKKIAETKFENTSVTIIEATEKDKELHLFDCSKHLEIPLNN